MEKNKMSGYIIAFCLPAIAIALYIFEEYVELGFREPDKYSWLTVIGHTLCLVCFFIPAKAIFKDKFMRGERITKKKQEYESKIGRLLNEKRLDEFRQWTDNEYLKRKQDYLETCLDLAGVTEIAVDCKNKNEKVQTIINKPSSLLKNKKLSFTQKIKLLKLSHYYARIKKINIEKVMSNTDRATVFNRQPSNMKRKEKHITRRKIMSCFLFAFASVFLTYTLNFNQETLIVLMAFLIRIFMSAASVASAYFVSKRLIDEDYFQELSEKALILDDFFNSTELNQKL